MSGLTDLLQLITTGTVIMAALAVAAVLPAMLSPALARELRRDDRDRCC